MWITTKINRVNTDPRYAYTVCHESWKRTFIDRHGGWEVSAMVLNNQEAWFRLIGERERWTKILEAFLAPKQIMAPYI